MLHCFRHAHRRRRCARSLAALAKLLETRDQPLVALVAVDHFLHQMFGARLISRGSVGVHEFAERGVQVEWVARMTAEICEHFQRFGVFGELIRGARQQLQELILLAPLDHRVAEFAKQRQSLFGLPSLRSEPRPRFGAAGNGRFRGPVAYARASAALSIWPDLISRSSSRSVTSPPVSASGWPSRIATA